MRYIIVTVDNVLAGDSADYQLIVDTAPASGGPVAVARVLATIAAAIRDALNETA